jgi:hypothetical protein
MKFLHVTAELSHAERQTDNQRADIEIDGNDKNDKNDKIRGQAYR